MEKSGLRILVVQTAFIGDVVLTTPMLAALRSCRPDDHISVLVKPEAAPFLANHPAVDRVIVFDKGGSHRGAGMLRLIREIRRSRFHLLLSPHQSHRTGIVSLLSRIPVRYGYASAGFARLAYNRRLTRPMERPEIHRLLQFLRDSICPGLPDSVDDTPSLAESPEAIARAEALLTSLHIQGREARPILLAISSIWETKRWTPWGFAELAGRLFEAHGQEILLVGSRGDSDVAAAVLGFAKEMLSPSVAAHIHNICGRTDLPTLFALMRRSLLLVSNDSAPVHFGCAAGIPVVAIFGATTTSLGYAPFAPRTIVAEVPLDCRPCGSHGGHSCPLGHFRCMKDLTAAMVFDHVRTVMDA